MKDLFIALSTIEGRKKDKIKRRPSPIFYGGRSFIFSEIDLGFVLVSFVFFGTPPNHWRPFFAEKRLRITNLDIIILKVVYLSQHKQ